MILKAGAAIIGAYLVLRGLAEFVLGDPSTYRHDWGGPSHGAPRREHPDDHLAG